MTELLSTAEAAAARVVMANPILEIAAAVGAVALVVGVGGFGWWFLSAPQRAANAEAKARVATVQGAGTQAAETQAAQIIDQGGKRDAQVIVIHDRNAAAIAALPSASTVAGSPGDADAWRAGICVYQSTRADPQCDRLLKAYPAVLPRAGS